MKTTKLGQFIREKREKLNLSRKEFSEKMDENDRISASTIGQIETGWIKRPPLNRLRQFAKILGVSVQKLKNLLIAITTSTVIAWFSAGATSAVACKLAIEKYGADNVKILCIDPGTASKPDNLRFMQQCQKLYSRIAGKKVVIDTVKNEQGFNDHWEVIKKVRFIKSPKGCPCTRILKREVNDLIFSLIPNVKKEIFGYDNSECKRCQDFQARNPDRKVETPLIENGLSKANCFWILKSLGIDLPENYNSFCNNNCVGCPKGGAGYWNTVRKTNPEAFNRMAKLEREIGHAILKTTRKGKKVKVFLDELDPNAGIFPEPIKPIKP